MLTEEPEEVETSVKTDEGKAESVLSDLLNFIRDEAVIVKTERQAEVIAGNIVKEALWQGEWAAYRKIISFLWYRQPENEELRKIFEET